MTTPKRVTLVEALKKSKLWEDGIVDALEVEDFLNEQQAIIDRTMMVRPDYEEWRKIIDEYMRSNWVSCTIPDRILTALNITKNKE